MTPAQTDEQLAGLTFATAAGGGPGEAWTRSDPAWRRRDLWLSVVLAVCVGLVWLAFR